jgi:hypothetical protein
LTGAAANNWKLGGDFSSILKSSSGEAYRVASEVSILIRLAKGYERMQRAESQGVERGRFGIICAKKPVGV